MKKSRPVVEDYVQRLQSVLASLDARSIEALVEALRRAYDEERGIFIMGNGGSGATASHIACDLNKGACFQAKKKFRVLALTDNMPTILALANDVGYEAVFVEQLKCFAKPGDVVIGISGSGNSPNVLRAVEHANALGCITVGLTGFNGGKLRPLAKLSVHTSCDDMQIVEDTHLIIGHILMQALANA